MSFRNWTMRAALGAAAVGLVACGAPTTNSGETTLDGQEKTAPAGGGDKADAWNWLNNPERFRADLNYNFNEISEYKKGETDVEIWASTYWPTYEDGINVRWQGTDKLSPAEKYDKAFNEWSPEEGFMDLKPYDTDTCEWDEEYYQSLGPAAEEASRDGNWRAHNGRDDDGDGVSDKEECGWGEDKDYDGIETWWGLCHAWVPAAMLEPEPKNPVTRNGVTFEVADMKALIIDQYDKSDAYMIGGRCNDKGDDLERDDLGRIEKDKCQDVNAGTFYVIMTNFLGKQGRPIAEDKTYDYEVWNQPIVEYEITKQEEVELSRVQELFGVREITEDSQPESDKEKEKVLELANTLEKQELIDKVGLREEKADAAIKYREENEEFSSSWRLESELGSRAVSRLLNYAYDEGILTQNPALREGYDFNPVAEKLYEVKMSVGYVTESQASPEPNADNLEQYIRTDRYHMLVEVDGDGDVVGGVWVGRSIKKHPDFLWLPTRARSGSRNIDLATVRDLVAESRGEDMMEKMKTFTSEATTEIPDADPQGATSTITVEDEGELAGLTLDLEIEHTYRGDLVVHLQKGNTEVLVYAGSDADKPWTDDVSITGETIGGFEGMDIQGDWNLKVVDGAARDTGSITDWALHTELK